MFVQVCVCVCLSRELWVTGMWTVRVRDAQVPNGHTHTFAVSLGKAHVPGGAFEVLRHTTASDWLGEDARKGAKLHLLPPPACVRKEIA